MPTLLRTARPPRRMGLLRAVLTLRWLRLKLWWLRLKFAWRGHDWPRGL
jgi:hypothetical protein